MFFVYRIEEVPFRSGDDPRDTRRYSGYDRKVYVGMHDSMEDARRDADMWREIEGTPCEIVEVPSWPISLSAAMACGQEYRLNQRDRASNWALA